MLAGGGTLNPKATNRHSQLDPCRWQRRLLGCTDTVTITGIRAATTNHHVNLTSP